MKKLSKQLLALMLALVVAFTFAPVKAQAANVKVKISRSGKVKAVYYKGGKAKKASFSMTSVKQENGMIDKNTGKEYDLYEVTATLKRAKLSKTEIAKTIQESRKKGGHINDYMLVLVDANGDKISDGGIYSGGVDYGSSSSSKTLKAKEGYRNYYIYGWRKTTTYKYKVLVPKGQNNVYLGFAGLKNGQVKKSKVDKIENGGIPYYKGGFGNKKKGFVVAGSVAD